MTVKSSGELSLRLLTTCPAKETAVRGKAFSREIDVTFRKGGL